MSEAGVPSWGGVAARNLARECEGARCPPAESGLHAGQYCVDRAATEPALPCINCGACVPVCPVDLRPDALHRALAANDLDRAAALDLDACLECGACNAPCPSRIPLAQDFRAGRAALARARRDAAAAVAARDRYASRERRLRERAEADARRARERERAPRRW